MGRRDTGPGQSRPDSRTRSRRRLVGMIGWVGTILVLGVYCLSTNGYLDSASTIARTINLVGALAICVLCWQKKTWQVFVLNAVWAAIAGYALLAAWMS